MTMSMNTTNTYTHAGRIHSFVMQMNQRCACAVFLFHFLVAPDEYSWRHRDHSVFCRYGNRHPSRDSTSSSIISCIWD